jgi:polyhydroxybutyrate depolymerase
MKALPLGRPLGQNGGMMRFLFTLLALVFFLNAPALAGDDIHDMNYTGVRRDYIVHTPPQYALDSRLPVVVALHGGGGSAAGMQKSYNLDSYADKYGMIIVYPDGVPSPVGNFHTWNAGLCCGKARKDKADDTGFLTAVIDRVLKGYHADPHRVFVTGHSNGAMMAYRLACDIPDRIAAIAPVAGQDISGCAAPKPVPVLHIHGTEDRCALYNGGPSCGGCFAAALHLQGSDDTWPCPAVQESLEKRAVALGCKDETETVSRNGPVTCERWKDCPARAGVTLCRIDGGGHDWQGSAPELCARNPNSRLCLSWIKQVGPVLDDVDTNGMIFDFFSKF